MSREEIVIGRAILSFLVINNGKSTAQNLIHFLSFNEGYKKEELQKVMQLLVNLELIRLHKEGIYEVVFLTPNGTLASGMGLNKYLATINPSSIDIRSKKKTFLDYLRSMF